VTNSIRAGSEAYPSATGVANDGARRDVSQWLAVADDALDERGLPVNSQTGVEVGNRDLLAGGQLDSSTKPGGPPCFSTQRVTNVMAEYT
jgi:hypothetical protein